MDAISYAHSAKQEQRIKKFINDPDSTSGVVTVPKVIASGETITIPAGRMAVLPNVQVDGTLNVQGDVFIPSGSTMTGLVEKVTSTDNAVVRFDGTTGKVQNSGVIIDASNNIGVGITTPTLTGAADKAVHIHANTESQIHLTNTTTGSTSSDGSVISVASNNNLYLYNKESASVIIGTNNSDRVIVDSSGNVGFGVTPSAWSGKNVIDIGALGSLFSDTVSGGSNGVSGNAYFNNGWRYKNSIDKPTIYDLYNGSHRWFTAPSGTAGNAITWTNAMTLDSGGRLLVGTTTAGSTSQNGVSVNNVSDSTYISINHSNGTNSTAWYQNFSYNGIQIGSIYQTGTTAVVYATTSDYRLKQNIRPADCKKFMDIKFVDYERIDGRHECGVIAHELQEIYPDLVTGEKDATEIRKVEISPAVEEVKDEDGNIITEAVEAVYEEQEFPVYQQVNYMGLIARIGTVVQQQAKQIEAMRAEIDELKGAK